MAGLASPTSNYLCGRLASESASGPTPVWPGLRAGLYSRHGMAPWITAGTFGWVHGVHWGAWGAQGAWGTHPSHMLLPTRQGQGRLGRAGLGRIAGMSWGALGWAGQGVAVHTMVAYAMLSPSKAEHST